MTISSIAAQTSLSALTAASQTGAMQIPGDDDSDELAAAADGNLTGSTTASLSSQTMQALLNLTQGSDPGAQTQQAPGGAHHHHHHHGGGQPPQQTDSSTASGTAATSTTGANADPGIAESDAADETQDSLASTLTSALAMG